MPANARVSVELQFVQLKAVKADEVSDWGFFSQLSVVSGVLYVSQLPHTKLLYIPKYFEVKQNQDSYFAESYLCLCFMCVSCNPHGRPRKKFLSDVPFRK